MLLQIVGLFFFLHLVPLHCKLILSTKASSLVQNEESHVEILHTSLQRFDNFTLCARSDIQNTKDYILLVPYEHMRK